VADAATETPTDETATGASTETGGSTEGGTATSPLLSGAPGADVVRPEGLPDTLWDADAKAPKWTDVTARLTRADELEAAETARKEGVPTEAKDYKLDPSGDALVGLDGKPAAIDAANPLAQAVTSVAHKHGLPQAVVSDFARAYIETELAGEKAIKEALDAEVAKLGDKATERVTAVQTFIRAHCGADADAAIAGLGSAGAVQAFEALMAKFTGATITTVPGQDVKAKSLAETWFPSMNKTKAA
jgi:hypothetical protein